MAKKKGGSVKLVDDVLVTSVDLTADVTGVLPVARGGTNLGAAGANGDVLTTVAGAPAWAAPSAPGAATGTWAAPAAEAANKIDISLQLKDGTGTNLAVATAEVEIMVSDSVTDAEPSATTTLGPATAPLGTILSGSGSATITARCSALGVIAVGVTTADVGNKFLWIRQGKNSQWFVRAIAAPVQLTFA